MIRSLPKLLRVMVLLLVATMVGHDAAAAAHPLFCLDEHHQASHEGTHGQDGAHETVFASAPEDGVQKQVSPGKVAQTCHSTTTGCQGCNLGSIVTIVPPDAADQRIPTAFVAFATIHPGVDHPPPKRDL